MTTSRDQLARPTDGIEIRPITDDEVEALCDAVVRGFGDDSDKEFPDRVRRSMPLDRTLAAFDGPDIVGTFGEYPLQVTVPGGAQLDMAGTTFVTVRSTHRRRGLLRAMMTQHLETIASRGDMLAGLWASEAPIYGRFGYGLATHGLTIKLDAARVDVPVRDTSMRIDPIAADQLNEIVGPLWNSVAKRQPGFLSRDSTRWELIAADPEAHRGGASARRHVVVRSGDDVVGYVSYRQRPGWEGPVATGGVEIEVLISADVAAHSALWNHLTTIDLFANISYWNVAVDDALMVLATDVRQVKRTMHDAGYIRILDLPGALQARTYEVDGSLTLQVNDEFGYADGTFSVEISNGKATVTPADAAADAGADLELSIEALGALYLGGSNAPQLAAAGKIMGDHEMVAKLDRLMRTTTAPWFPYEF